MRKSDLLRRNASIAPTDMSTAAASPSETKRAAAGVRPHRMRWTRMQYEKLADTAILPPDTSTELIHGQICTMSPQNSRHATALTLTDAALRSQYDTNAFLFRIQLPLALGPHSEPEPDIAIIEGQARDFVDAHPTTAILVVEVADASLSFDRSTKHQLYANHGISTYWIVNLPDACIEVYTDPKPDCYGTKDTFTSGDAVAPPTLDNSVPVDDLLP